MSLTLMAVAPLITWLFVSTSPEEVSTIPVPAAFSSWNPRTVSTSTSPGSTLSAMEETSVEPDPVAVDEDEADVPEEFDPNPGGADIDDGDADTGGLPFEPTRPSPRTAAMVTTAAPTRALFRSRWERWAGGCGGGALHVGGDLFPRPSSPSSMFACPNSASVIWCPSSIASMPLRRPERFAL